MSEMEPFDKELRSLFEQETVQPGSDLDWGNMDISVPPRKTKKGFFWYLLATSGLVVLLLGAIFIFQNQSNDKIGNTEQQSSLEHTRETSVSNKSDIPVNKPTEIASNDAAKENDLQLSSETITSIPSKISKETEKKSLGSELEKEGTNKAINKEKGISENARVEKSTTLETSLTEEKPKVNIQSHYRQEYAAISGAMNSDNDEVVIESNEELDRLETIELSNSLQSIQQGFDIESIKENLSLIKPISLKVKNNSNWFITVLGGLNYTEKEYTSQSINGYNEIVNDLIDPSTGINASLLIGKQLTNRLSVSTGISYDQYNSIFRYREFLGADNSVQNLLLTTVDSFRRVVQNNRTDNISIPVNLNFSFITKDKFKIGLSPGIGLNFHKRIQGKILNEDLSIVNSSGFLFPDSQPLEGLSRFQQNISLSYSLELNFQIKLADKLGLMISSGVQSNNLKLFNQSALDIRESISLIYRNRIGLSFNLN